MLPVLNIGPFALPTAPLVLLLGIWLATSAVEHAARYLGQPVNANYGVAVGALFGGLVGARLVFVLRHWSAYRVNPLGVIWPLNSGYDLWGGLLVAALVGFWLARRHRLPGPATLDVLAPGALLFLACQSLADFLGGPGYGTTTAMPWGISLANLTVRRHPVQIYEIAVAGLALWAWRGGRAPGPAGRALLATAVYAGGRLFTEAFRADAWLTTGGYRGLQLLALPIMAAALYLLARRLPPAASAGEA